MKDVSKKIGEIAELCATLSKTTDNDYFFCYQPHTDEIDVRVHVGGWTYDSFSEPVEPCKNINGIIYLSDEEMVNG